MRQLRKAKAGRGELESVSGHLPGLCSVADTRGAIGLYTGVCLVRCSFVRKFEAVGSLYP